MSDEEQRIELRRRRAPAADPSPPPPAADPLIDEAEADWRAGLEQQAAAIEARGRPTFEHEGQDQAIVGRDGTVTTQRVTYVRGDRPDLSLPYNVDAEAALLGALMTDNRLVEVLRSRLWEKHFFEPVHGRIYGAILRIMDRNGVANPVTLRPYLQDDPAIVKLGGMRYVAGLVGPIAMVIGAREIAQQVIELATRRELLAVIDKADELLLDPFGSTDEAITAIDTALSEASYRAKPTSTVSVQKAWDEAFVEMEDAGNGVEPEGVLIDGYDDWNDVVGRLPPGDLVYLAGRPSMGKTGVAVSVAMGAAERMLRVETGPTAGAVEFFSLEMSRRPIMQRAIANVIFDPGRTSSFEALTEGRFTSIDRDAIRRARQMIDGYPMNISDPALIMVENFAAEIRRAQREWRKKGRELKLVVVDYLSRFGTTGRFSGTGERVAHISKTVKDALRQCGVAGVVLAQLSRAVEGRDDKRPLLSDLRDSGTLEQDADVVVFVYRDEYYLKGSQPPRSQEKKWEAWDQEMRVAQDRMELIGAKRRQGALIRRTGYFFTHSQAIRASGFRNGNDLFADYED